jgi:hypothetical protein
MAYQNLRRPGVTSRTVSQFDDFKSAINRDVRGQFNFDCFIVNRMKASNTMSKNKIQNTKYQEYEVTFQKVEVIN